MAYDHGVTGMNCFEVTECLRLLDAADSILLSAGENVLAAHLSAVIEPIRGMLDGGIAAHIAMGKATH
jgi:hypothetical protein